MMSREEKDRIALKVFGVHSYVVSTAVAVAMWKAGRDMGEEVLELVPSPKEQAGEADMIVLMKDGTWIRVELSQDMDWMLRLAGDAMEMESSMAVSETQRVIAKAARG